MVMELIIRDAEKNGYETDQSNTAENQIYDQIHQDNDKLSSGYSTISSGTDQEDLVEKK